jgi:hypothetical protein
LSYDFGTFERLDWGETGRLKPGLHTSESTNLFYTGGSPGWRIDKPRLPIGFSRRRLASGKVQGEPGRVRLIKAAAPRSERASHTLFAVPFSQFSTCLITAVIIPTEWANGAFRFISCLKRAPVARSPSPPGRDSEESPESFRESFRGCVVPFGLGEGELLSRTPGICHKGVIRKTAWLKNPSVCTGKDGARCRFRTCDPFRVKEVLYR